MTTPASPPGTVFDGVIVGAGAAGMLAALKAEALGARVALLDSAKADEPAVAAPHYLSRSAVRYRPGSGYDE